MARYTGKDLDIQWIYDGGTVSLNGDFRSFKSAESTDMADKSAGNDTHKSSIPKLTAGKVDIDFLDTTGTAGTQVWGALAVQTDGTLVWSPQGTAAGKPKHSCHSIVTGRDRDFPYDDVVTVKASYELQEDVSDDVWS